MSTVTQIQTDFAPTHTVWLVEATSFMDVVLHGVEAVATLMIAWAAFQGLQAWRREFIGKREIELGDEVRQLAYEVKDAIYAARLPMSARKVNRPAVDGDTQAVSDHRDYLFSPAQRLMDNHTLLEEFRRARLRFMARHGQERGAPFDVIISVWARIKFTSEHLAYAYNPHVAQGAREMLASFEELIFSRGSDESDAVEARVSRAVHEIEQFSLEAR